MKQFLRRISPRRAVADLVTVWRQPTEHRWGLLGVAIAMTFALFMLFIPKSQMVEPEMPEVIYISTWAEGRTEAEIIASNCRNQQLRDELESLLAQRAEIRRDIYKALGRATFIDVDAIEAEAEAARAAEQAANSVPLPENVDPLARLSVEEYCARAAG
ncbi:hypothetical protein [Altererythrobacter lauratis]|uniref:Metal-dependent phosphohydrolase 7TM extracellular domain-containing protein n=1 Tax=Alteraurantiacibacter lauratis TaxID=2054627 RepID=A0ABV7EGQ9_9SPHN